MTDNRTTELREKLTERGIEYTANDHMGAYETSWNGFTAMQLTPGAKLMMVFTPEQAIAATLGNSRAERTCHINELDALTQTLSMVNGCSWGECSECGCLTPTDSVFCVECGAKVRNE